MKLVFTLAERMYEVSGHDLAAARISAGMTQREAARRCGWSSTWQCTMEHTAVVCMPEANMLVIEAVFAAFGVPIEIIEH